MPRSKYKLLFPLIPFVFAQVPGTLWAQSYGVINTFAGNGSGGFAGDGGPATEAALNSPADVAIHPTTGDIYIADQRNNRIRKVDSTGVITTVAGSVLGIDVDNVPATSAGLVNPSGIAFDAAGNLYIADTGHHKIRRVDGATGIITTVAGTGNAGYNGDNKLATSVKLNYPDHVALDSAGNLFIADDANHRVRRVDAGSGIIRTVAGTGDDGDSGDGLLATTARLTNPHGVLVDPVGNIFIADTGNHRVRFVDPGGVIHPYAGTGLIGDTGNQEGPAIDARFRAPIGLGRDAQGNIFIADFGSNRVREVIRQTNTIITVAGTGVFGFRGDGDPAEEARIAAPESATINDRGWIYIAESASNVVRLVDHFSQPTTIEVFGGSPQSTAVGSAFSQPLVAIVKDATGTPLPGVQVAFSAPVSGATASLSGSVVTTGANGQASVNATANTVLGSYAVSAAVSGLAPALFTLTNTIGAPAKIQFSQQPSDASAGASIAPAVTVSLTDASNHPIAGVPVTLTVVGGSAALAGGGPANTDVSGLATFGNLKITKAGTYRLQASGASLTASSGSFNITAGSQTSIAVLSGGGQSASVGGPYAAPLQATVADPFGNPVAGVAVTFAAPTNNASVTFGGSATATVTTSSAGVAESPAMTANGTTGSFQVTATAAGVPSSAAFTLVNVAGTSSHLAFVQQPTDTAAGAPMTTVTVQLKDSFGNNVATQGVSVTLQVEPVAGKPSGFTALPIHSTDANGLATFAGLTFTQPGQFVLLAQATAVATATSSAFTIRAGAPAKIQATGGTPQTATIQTAFAQQLTAKVLDAFDNPVSGVTVVFTAPSSGASATLSAPAITDATGQTSVTATANTVAGLYSVTASPAGVAASASFSLTNVAGSVGHVVFVQKPSNSAAGAVISPPVTVKVSDAGSNPLSGVSVTINVQGGTPALGGTLGATTDASGVAAFSDLSITVAGIYRLEAASSGISGVSDPFLISPATSAVTIAAFDGNGQHAAVGTIYSGPLKALVEDPYHNPVPNASVTFAAPSSDASVTFSGPTTVTSGIDGVAIAPAMTANSQVGGFQVTAITAAASAPALFTLINLAGAANKLAFVQQPVDTVAGVPITPAVTVQLQDSAGNAVRTAGILVTLQANASVVRLHQLSGSATQSTNAAGVASFPTLSVSQAGTYTLQASSDGLTSATSNPFRITAGTAAKIETNGGTPQSATVLTPFPQPLQVTVLDANNNPVSGAPVTFAAPGSGASATLSALSTSTDANGHASVSATANSTAGTYSVTASVSGVSASASFSLTNVTGAPGQISFVQQPSNTPAGVAISPIIAKVLDSGGNPVNGAVVTISLQEATTTLDGTLTRTTGSDGMATFDDLSITTTGTYHLDVASGGVSALSNSFQITPASSAVVILAFEGDGQNATVGTTYSGPLKARVEDPYHNPIANASVTFTPPTSGASVTFAGSATVNTGADGIAISPDMTANAQTGTFQVTASTATASGPALFNLTNIPGNANKLAFVQQPVSTVAGATITPAVTVQVRDSSGNAVHTAGIMVTLQADATVRRLKELSGTATQPTDSSGLATFANLSINQAGSYTLQANANGLSSDTSQSFTITAGTAAQIESTGGATQSTIVLTAFAQPLQATVLDANNNPVSGATVTFGAPGSGASATLSALSAVTDTSGHATVTATANGTAGCYAVSASTSGVTPSATYSLCNAAAGASQIVFTGQPSNTQAGVPISPPVVARLTDAGGNGVSGATITMSLSGGGVLGGTTTATTNAAGEATFDNLLVNTSGAYQLAAVNGSVSAVSNSFQVSPATASVTISVYDGDGQSALAGAPYAGPLKALVVDLFGNPLSGIAVTFAAPGTGPSVTFAGSATVNTDANGIATSPAMTANTVSGPFVVTARAPNAPAPANFPLANLQATANQLKFLQHPTDTPAGVIVTPPVMVQLLDSSGTPVHTANVPVTLQVNVPGRGPGAFSGLDTQATDANGLATFANLKGARAGTYQLQAQTNSVASDTSNAFQITPGTADTILASGGTPQSAIILTAFGAPLEVTVTDATGNPVAGVPIVFLAPSSGASGSFSVQSTITVNTNAQGRVSVVITANNIAGTYGVTASSTGITGSALFTLTNLPPAASSLVFVQQPGNTAIGQVIAPPVTVQVRDTSGSPVQVAGGPITISLAEGTGVLSGTLVQLTDATGLAAFPDLRLDQPGAMRLRAIAPGRSPAESNTFQVAPGPASSIVAFSGSPQSATVSQPFPELLKAQVNDSTGHPVSGVSVTFSTPSSGPSGTFAAPATATTDATGIATAPSLTAGSQPGDWVVTAAATGVSAPAMFALANLPDQSSLVVAPGILFFTSEVNQPAPSAQSALITSSGATPVNWGATPSASWLAAEPGAGTTPGQIDVTVNPAGLAPGTYTGVIRIVNNAAVAALVQVTYTISDKPALIIAPPTLVFSTIDSSVTPPAQTLRPTSSSRPIRYNVTVPALPSGGTWLQVTPATGTTPGTVSVTANPAGLGNGIYDGIVLFSPTEAGLNQVAVPVTLIVGCTQGGCQQQPNIVSVVNGASFQPGGSPRAIMTILGTDLSDGVYQSTTPSLPLSLGPTSVTVNGFAAPLYYASPTQINFQMPSVPPGKVVVTVTNNATRNSRAVPSSPVEGVTLTQVNPGLFTTPDKRASALNGDLSVHTAATPIPAGGYVILYATGEGPVTPPIPDGVPAPSSPLSIINAQVQVTIGGVAAQVAFKGAAPSLVGVAQFNVIVPAGLTPGDQPVFITLDGISSNTGLITVR
jgi:uncharacterized protein (TIGR03437 family)